MDHGLVARVMGGQLILLMEVEKRKKALNQTVLANEISSYHPSYKYYQNYKENVHKHI